MNSQQLSGATVPNKNSHAVPGTRVAISLAIAAMLSACAFAPGQHMITPAAVPVTTAENGDVTSDMQIPIKQIDLTLIRQIHAEQKSNTMAQAQLNLFAKPAGYKLGAGDVLQIVVWDHPELAAALGQPAQNTRPGDAAPGFVVDSEGNIQFPYVTHAIHAAGKTPEQIQREIYADLSKVFVKPQVTVRVASFRSSQVYVDGDVRAPGAQTINDIPMTLTEAVNRAGGFAPTADQSRVTITRNGTAYPVNVAQMLKQGKNPADIMLQPVKPSCRQVRSTRKPPMRRSFSWSARQPETLRLSIASMHARRCPCCLQTSFRSRRKTLSMSTTAVLSAPAAC
jgi:polysaccharide export outer membrane protein